MPAAMPAAASRPWWLPGRGIAKDVTQRLIPHYRSDWVVGWSLGTRVLPPVTYIFFASFLPALAFGQQLATETEGTLNVVHVLVATALAGIVQAVAGGQPLLIIGVAEPIVIIYGFMYMFAKSAPGLGVSLFLPWAGWVCIWTALLCCVLAVLGASEGIAYFTRFSGELFGALIAILFLQVGIKGIVNGFYLAAEQDTAAAVPTTSSSSEALPWQLVLINGLWSLMLSLALLLSCLAILKARSWRLGRSWLRGFLADYGVPLLVVLWSGVSFAVSPAPHVPRRVATPNTWEVRDTWTVSGRLGEVPGRYIAAALVPSVIITLLFYFDHNVSSQMAQQPEFNLVKGPAYHWDFLILSILTLVCGLLGLPPVNGVLPQAPMHTRSLAHINTKQQRPGAWKDSTAGAAGIPAHMSSSNSAGGSTIGATTGTVAAGSAAADAPAVPVTAAAQALTQLTVVSSYAQEGSMLARSSAARWQPQQQESGFGITGPPSGLQSSTPHHPQQFAPPLAAASASASASSAAACSSSQQEAVLRHRLRLQSLSPRAGPPTNGCAPQPQHQQEPSLQEQQTPGHSSHGQQLHLSRSDVAINTLPDSSGLDPCAEPSAGQGTYLVLEVHEQRVSNLLQSLLVAVCLGATPAIQQVPTGVLWGYFIFMAVKSLEGSQLWERLLLLLTDPKKRVDVLQQEHAAYMQLVPYRVVVRFTLLQLVYLLGVWALTTWAGIAGIAFPLPIMALVPLRQFVLPRLFEPAHLRQLDAAGYEEAPAVQDRRKAAQELYELGALAEAPAAQELPVAAPGNAPQGVQWGEEEAEVVSKEFHGLHLRHHLTRESLEQQQQQLQLRRHQLQ